MSITALNLYSIRTLLDNPPAIIKNLLRPLVASGIMGVFVYAALRGLEHLGITSRLLLCFIPISVGVVVYCVSAAALKAITREDCLLLPKGEKIAKLLRL